MIKTKTGDNNLMVAEASKGKTVVLKKQNYGDKVYAFLWACFLM
jgi:hypothetical protein